jgi:hypothetical protein
MRHGSAGFAAVFMSSFSSSKACANHEPRLKRCANRSKTVAFFMKKGPLLLCEKLSKWLTFNHKSLWHKAKSTFALLEKVSKVRNWLITTT